MAVYNNMQRFNDYVIELKDRCKYSDDIVEKNLLFVVSEAKKYITQDVPIEDIVQAGNYGMMLASQKFKDDGSCEFITYAKHWIKKCIIEECNNRRVFQPKHKTPVTSLDTTMLHTNDGGEIKLADTLRDTSIHNSEPFVAIVAGEDLCDLDHAISQLTDEERMVVEEYYGIGGRPRMNYREISEIVGTTTQWIQNVNSTAKQKLKKILSE